MNDSPKETDKQDTLDSETSSFWWQFRPLLTDEELKLVLGYPDTKGASLFQTKPRD